MRLVVISSEYWLWKAKFFICCDVIIMLRSRGNLTLITLRSEKAKGEEGGGNRMEMGRGGGSRRERRIGRGEGRGWGREWGRERRERGGEKGGKGIRRGKGEKRRGRGGGKGAGMGPKEEGYHLWKEAAASRKLTYFLFVANRNSDQFCQRHDIKHQSTLPSITKV